ncbi:hypothetical protein JTE90_022652 [Oedothorax gibbosus]|uniref:Uncharacterized protein n=1 Tax=Oedothorax gibbosus TaxID=931172 RepID=A0AAV6TNZ9_9ARAC|nr:hypothetical protein JTE90_023696 [Oedothorax gibbosus]KAG8175229.1 hypothetical protein JTE90_022652 [Oedothorax gibbosus]
MEPSHVVEASYASDTFLQQFVTQALVQELRDNPNSHLTYETMVVRILKRLAEEGFGLSWDHQILETTRHVYVPPALHALLEHVWKERKTSAVTLEEQHCIERILGRDYVRQTDLVKLAGCVHKFARDEKDVWMLFAVDGLLGQDPKRYVDSLRCEEGPKAKHVRLVRKWYLEERVKHPAEMKEILEDVFQRGAGEKEYVEAVGEESVKQIVEWFEIRKKRAEGESSRKRSKTAVESE